MPTLPQERGAAHPPRRRPRVAMTLATGTRALSGVVECFQLCFSLPQLRITGSKFGSQAPNLVLETLSLCHRYEPLPKPGRDVGCREGCDSS